MSSSKKRRSVTQERMSLNDHPGVNASGSIRSSRIADFPLLRASPDRAQQY